ncbi:MAG: type II toxin-antitoxin system CcdA family antitoxin [Thermoproteota archaeon]
MSEVVTVRLSKELKKKIKELKIDVSEFVRKSLEEEVKRREREALLSSLAEVKRTLSKISDDEIVQVIRSSRESR